MRQAKAVLEDLQSGALAKEVADIKAGKARAGATTKIPRPSNAYGTNAVAWDAFIALDTDGDGTLSRQELGQLVDKLHMKLGA